jgi:hypothetical protein
LYNHCEEKILVESKSSSNDDDPLGQECKHRENCT